MKTILSTTEAANTLMKFEAFGTEPFGTGADSYSLCYTMAEWLEQYEYDTGEELELDPVAIRCEYRVIELRDVCEEYTIDSEEDPLEYLESNTIVIPTDFVDTYIIQEW